MRVVIRPGKKTRDMESQHLTPNSHRTALAKNARIAAAVPSKSMAHRLLVCAALAHGPSQVGNLSHSTDIDATAAAIELLGAQVNWTGNSAAVHGCPPGCHSPSASINCVESGSTLRFLIPLCSLQGKPVTFTGAKRLFERPLGPYEAIYMQRGLLFERTENSLLIGGPLTSGEYRLPGNVSSQFISGLLFALPLLPGDSRIVIDPPFESWGYVTLTRRAQEHFNITSAWAGPLTLLVPGGQHYRPSSVTVEGDWSQGSVYVAMAAAIGGLAISGLDPNSPQGDRTMLDIVRSAGANVSFKDGLLYVAPPAGGLVSPGEVNLANCPDLGPVLCAFSALCRGTTQIVNAGRLRIKESDRIASMEVELAKLGVPITTTGDSITIEGGPLKDGVTVQSHNDHRVVMAMACLACCAGITLTIEGAEAVEKSWPRFFEDLGRLDVAVEHT